MSVLRLASIFNRSGGELVAACRSILPFAAESACVSAQASTSAPVVREELVPFLIHRRKSRSLLLPFQPARHVHHDHHECTQHCNHTAQKPSPAQQHGDRRLLTLEDLEKACWSCEKRVKRGGLVCNGCETIQPPDESLNYFDLFSLPSNSFDVNPQQLERRYKALQWSLHPDKMGHKPAEEREFSAQHASIVNLAYSILKSPLSRANYMLALRGIAAGDNFEGTIEDPELLMEVLEAREEVEETDDPAALSGLLARNRRQQEGLVSQLSAAFRSGDMAAAVGLTHQLQYVAKLEQEIVNKLPELPET